MKGMRDDECILGCGREQDQENGSGLCRECLDKLPPPPEPPFLHRVFYFFLRIIGFYP